ncbi:hypothetical protein PG985_001264 [Apiospora marii]|uniref:Uncharacterized protein n=1 Tax=Apiospora marii TaxID=335849 RepID=A0ABR1RHE1_9PEZI
MDTPTTAGSDMDPREFYENNVNAALQRSQEVFATPVLGTNLRLEMVARILIRRGEEILQYLERGDDAISSTDFAAKWEHVAGGVSALNYLSLQSRESEKAIHDLRAMHVHYLSLKYEYHSYKKYQRLQAMRRNTPGPVPSLEGRDLIGDLGHNLASHLLLDKKWWTRTSLELQQELNRHRRWEQHGPPKSKAPSAPKCTWLNGLLDLFYSKDTSTAVEIIRSALATEFEPFKAMSIRHAGLVNEGLDQLALDEVDRDLGLLMTWVPKEYDTEPLERAIVCYKDKILHYRYEVEVTRYRASVSRSQLGGQLRRKASGQRSCRHR